MMSLFLFLLIFLVQYCRFQNTKIQSEPFIRSFQDGCSDKTEAYRYRFWRIFSSLYDSPISAPNRLVDLLTLYYGITMTKLRLIHIKCQSPQYIHSSPLAEVPSNFLIAGQLSGKNLPGNRTRACHIYRE